MKHTVTLIAACAALAATATAQPRYSIIDLGPVPAPGQPFEIANNGLTGGGIGRSDNTEHAMLWYVGLGLKQDIGKPGLGGPNSITYAVNQFGQASGAAQTAVKDPLGEDFCGFAALGLTSSGTCQGFLWQSGVMTALPTLGGNNGTAIWMNNAGTVVGTAENTVSDPACPAPQLFQFKPAVWQNGKVQALPTYPGDPSGVAYGINDNGDAAGQSGVCAPFNAGTLSNLQSLHAVLWQAGVPTYLGSLGGTGNGNGIGAFGLNNHDQVVGFSDLPGDQSTHAFLWSPGTGMQDLGTLGTDPYSFGVAVGDNGQVVGLSADQNFNTRAFLWQNGVMTEFNTLIPASSPLYPILACSINSSGLIIGQAVLKTTGEMHAYVAVPVSSLSAKERRGLDEAETTVPMALSEEARKVLQQRVRFGPRR